MHGGAACAGDGGGEGERDGDVMCRGAGERSEMGEGFLLRGEVEKCQELGEGEEGRRGGEMEKGEGTNSRGGGGGEEPEEKGRGEEGARSDLDASHGRNAAEAEEQETRSEDGKWIDLDEGDDVWLELEGDGAGDDRGTRMCVGWWDAIAYDELGEIPGDWGPYDPSC